ncbi:MAG: ABC transporter permease subunit, partial [Gammaproteobacteria bacterium]|nr:ABC transporter permease subunit [Gammaproteobacteria bacterium]
FMSRRARNLTKPAIETMEALPTVVLGFVAGLWLAPFVERHLPGLAAILLIVPAGVLLASLLWYRLPATLRLRLGDGRELLLMAPWLMLLIALSIALSAPIEHWLFEGDTRQWLSQALGVDFDQRNAIVVGMAMGFAVIPTVYSISEDALFGVPKHLTDASLALGASPWQTFARVVLPAASPGLYSAVMIGLGRAVGETMIVLMATGNTPVMDLSIFQGMRTLSANIAVELPEAEVNSSHYRILFLTALVLFAFTLCLNTLAELIRHRLRRRYGAL